MANHKNYNKNMIFISTGNIKQSDRGLLKRLIMTPKHIHVTFVLIIQQSHYNFTESCLAQIHCRKTSISTRFDEGDKA